MTQSEQILSALMDGEHLTPIAALDRFGCFRLAARINELRELGHDISTVIVETPDGKRYASYVLKGQMQLRLSA